MKTAAGKGMSSLPRVSAPLIDSENMETYAHKEQVLCNLLPIMIRRKAPIYIPNGIFRRRASFGRIDLCHANR